MAAGKGIKEGNRTSGSNSFKHVSPAGAVGLPLSDVEKKIYWVDDMDIEFTPLANAYIRARGADRMSSFGDFISLSDICDAATAKVIKREVSDGVIAPGYTEEALEILKQKKKGNYCVIEIDPAYEPAPIEHKDVFGITFEQGRNELHRSAGLMQFHCSEKNGSDLFGVFETGQPATTGFFCRFTSDCSSPERL